MRELSRVNGALARSNLARKNKQIGKLHGLVLLSHKTLNVLRQVTRHSCPSQALVTPESLQRGFSK